MFKIKPVKNGFSLDIFKEDALSSDDEDNIIDFFKSVLLEEIAKDRKDIEQLPDSKKFEDSFEVDIQDGEITVTSSWPWIDPYLEGKDPFPMTWLTRQRGAHKVPLHQKDGSVIVRMAPLSIGDAWIHPGFARHTFIQRAMNRTVEYISDTYAKKIADNF